MKHPPATHHTLTALTAFLFLIAAGGFQPAEAQSTHVAYVVPAGTPGNQDFNGSLGMDFDVTNPINVTKLGCFDDNSDGLFLPINVRLYNRDTVELLATVDFSPEDAGTLNGGSRFKSLVVPLNLPAGFRGTIVAEGYGAAERNGNRNPHPWTTDGGSSSIVFVGTGRFNFPVVIGAYPETPDAGPADLYAAGTFEFQTTPPQVPGAPIVAATPGDGRVDLGWPAVTEPLPAANYRVFRSDSPGGVFTQVAETTATTYGDTNVTNGTLYCYKVAGVGAGGQAGPESPVACARPFNLGPNRLIAYNTPWGVPGNQDFGGSLGMDFDVNNPVIIRELGCFDDNSDGLVSTITVRIYNRETQEELAVMVFDPDDTGTPEREDGEPINGMRFKPLPAPLNLPIGFRGLIAAEGYGAAERLRNGFGIPANIAWTTHDGNGSLSFVGLSSYGVGGGFPATIDMGPAARYAAGTFIYETTAPAAPMPPVIDGLVESHAVRLSWNVVTLPLPATQYTIFKAESAAGPFVQVGQTASTAFRVADLPNGVEACWTVRAVAAGGASSGDSNVVCLTPANRVGGIAYVVPPGTIGNQDFGGGLGMEFDVTRPVIVTQLGAFDSAGDGFQLPISVRLYNRDTLEVVASIDFGLGEDGELIDGSRLKDLPAAVTLPAGFRGMIAASGYGPAEQNGNLGIGDLGLTTFDGACLRFVGTSRFGTDPAAMPNTPDSGPANRYAAGTFAFVPDLPPDGLTISRATGGVRIEWTDLSGALEQSANFAPGSWTLVPGAAPGLVVPVTPPALFFRLSR